MDSLPVLKGLQTAGAAAVDLKDYVREQQVELVDQPSAGSWAVEVGHQGKLSHLGQRKDSRLASAVPLRERGGRSVRGEESVRKRIAEQKTDLFVGRSVPGSFWLPQSRVRQSGSFLRGRLSQSGGSAVTPVLIFCL